MLPFELYLLPFKSRDSQYYTCKHYRLFKCHTQFLCEHTHDLMELTDRNDHWKLKRLGRLLRLLENLVFVEKGCDHSCSSNYPDCPLYAPQDHLHLPKGLCFSYEILTSVSVSAGR